MFRNLSIQWKLTLLTAAMVVLAVVLVCGVFVYNHTASVRSVMVDHHTALAEVLADDSASALNFGEKKLAEEVLSSLRMEPSVEFACILDPKGKVFATYQKPDGNVTSDPAPQPNGYRFHQEGFLAVSRPVRQDARMLGTVYLRVRQDQLTTTLKNDLLVSSFVVLGSLVVVIVLGWFAQRLFTRPLLRLADATRSVSENADYSIRVRKGGNDEIGFLCDGFNTMLAEIQKRDSQLHELAVIVESSEDAIIGKTLAGIVTSWNRGAERLYGYSAEEMIGQSISRLIPAHRPDELPKILEQLKRGDNVDHYETIRLKKDGTTVDVSLTISAIKDAAGRPVGASAIARDITQQKRSQRALARYAADLERSNKDLDEFAYVASHDLRSPLQGVGKLAAWIRADNPDNLPDKSKRHLDQMQQRVRRLEALLDDLLQYSRAGRVHGNIVETDTAALANDIATLLAPPEGFTIDVSSEMPTIVTVKTPLEQVLRNLVNNSIKHHDRLDGRIEVSCTENGEFVEFAITDDGPGIDEQYHEQVFKMFETLKTRDEVEGSGMGLSVVKKTIESYGGHIVLESSPGSGATFRFTWPKTIQLN